MSAFGGKADILCRGVKTKSPWPPGKATKGHGGRQVGDGGVPACVESWEQTFAVAMTNNKNVLMTLRAASPHYIPPPSGGVIHPSLGPPVFCPP